MSFDNPATTTVPVSPPQAAEHDAVQCPYCSSKQFFGRRKVTVLGWVLYASAIVNLIVSIPMMFLFVGFVTIFLSPVLAIVGFFVCREHVNTCARCKRDF
jgi:DNA-directed RNA polymerase subunit RPC12/RpoP